MQSQQLITKTPALMNFDILYQLKNFKTFSLLESIFPTGERKSIHLKERTKSCHFIREYENSSFSYHEGKLLNFHVKLRKLNSQIVCS